MMNKSQSTQDKLRNMTAEIGSCLGTLDISPGARPDQDKRPRLAAIRSLLFRSAKALQATIGANDEPAIRVALEEYSAALSSLREQLLTFEARLQQERVRLQTEMHHVKATSSWAESAKLVG
jgi:hypothetical protein